MNIAVVIKQLEIVEFSILILVGRHAEGVDSDKVCWPILGEQLSQSQFAVHDQCLHHRAPSSLVRVAHSPLGHPGVPQLGGNLIDELPSNGVLGIVDSLVHHCQHLIHFLQQRFYSRAEALCGLALSILHQLHVLREGQGVIGAVRVTAFFHECG